MVPFKKGVGQGRKKTIHAMEGAMTMAMRNTIPYGTVLPHAQDVARPLDEASVQRSQAKEEGRRQTFLNACNALWERMPDGFSVTELARFDPPRAARIEIVEGQLEEVWGRALGGRATHMEFRKALEAWYRAHLTAFQSWTKRPSEQGDR